MKNQIVGGIVTFSVGVLIAVGPQTIFKICDQSHHHGASTCFWSGQALIGTGIVLSLLGLVYLFSRDPQVRKGLGVGVAINVLLTFFLANVLIGMDDDAMMTCRLKTLPALNVIATISFIAAVTNVLYLSWTKHSSEDGEKNEDTKSLNPQLGS